MARLKSPREEREIAARPFRKIFSDPCGCYLNNDPFCACPPISRYPRTRARDANVIYDDTLKSNIGINLRVDEIDFNADDICCRRMFIRMHRKNDRCFRPIDIPINDYTPREEGMNVYINWGPFVDHMPNGQYEGEIFIGERCYGCWLFIKIPRDKLSIYEYSTERRPPLPHNYIDEESGIRCPIVKVKDKEESNSCEEDCEECH